VEIFKDTLDEYHDDEALVKDADSLFENNEKCAGCCTLG
jgi:hypothetical protein